MPLMLYPSLMDNAGITFIIRKADAYPLT